MAKDLIEGRGGKGSMIVTPAERPVGGGMMKSKRKMRKRSTSSAR